MAVILQPGTNDEIQHTRGTRNTYKFIQGQDEPILYLTNSDPRHLSVNISSLLYTTVLQ